MPLVVPGVETIGTDRAGVVDLARPASIREGAGVPDRRARSVTDATSVPVLVVLLGEHAAASEALERGERADGVGRGRGGVTVPRGAEDPPDGLLDPRRLRTGLPTGLLASRGLRYPAKMIRTT